MAQRKRILIFPVFPLYDSVYTSVYTQINLTFNKFGEINVSQVLSKQLFSLGKQ